MSDTKKVIVGVCAMEKKSKGKPMREILTRMQGYYSGILEVLIFPEPVIREKEVTEWPHCDCLISFHSKDFPLNKAIEYSNLHPNVYVINDLERQYELMDRARVYEILKKNGIEHPKYEFLDRSNILDGEESTVLKEAQDFIEVNGAVFNKPFVEKPVSAEDHNICIYYPSSSGGGSQKLFRKVDNRSSIYCSSNRIRKEGSYIYEQFMQTAGTDVKVYAVGPDYAHAEARKCPALDGKVERNADGKEVRYPVILTAREKMIARKVVLAFKQTVCGFDLLRANGQSFVCDVNGFSFVKSSQKYYEDTAKILGNMILRRLSRTLRIPWKQPYQPDDPPLVSTTYGKMMELRCVLGIIRHGDRTPKQKMKMEVTDQRFFKLFEEHEGFKNGELKLKKPSHLKEVLSLSRVLLVEGRNSLAALQEDLKQLLQADGKNRGEDVEFVGQKIEKVQDDIRQWDQVRGVLEMYGYFSGINRKVQLKFCPHGRSRRSSESESDPSNRRPSLLLILKWGGELTTAGRIQAESLGRLFRTLYPGIEGVEGEEDYQGLGFLRLHSTYRHDLKIYASDEGRVQMTAAAFTKGLLALEGELAPILSQMVKSANTDGLLDDDYYARKYQSEVKKFLHDYLQMDKELTTDEDIEQLNPLGSRAIRQALTAITNPKKACEAIYQRMKNQYDVLRQRRVTMRGEGPGSVKLYLNETWDLVERRWLKLIRDFRRMKKDGSYDFDISKIPDIYDNIRYDIQHNRGVLRLEEATELYYHVKLMADVVVPQEYGIKKTQKQSIAQGYCIPLMKKIRTDLQRCIEGVVEDENLTRLDPRASQGIATPLRHVRTRLYFTSESHIHSVMNLIRYGGLFEPDSNDKQWQRAMNFLSAVSEFNYMSQVVLLMYEDPAKDPLSADRFHVELLFSPGLFPVFLRPKPGAVGKYRSRRKNKDNANGSASKGDKTEDSLQEEEEDDHSANENFNTVSLQEVLHAPYTNEELARHSPPGTPSRQKTPDPTIPVMKALSDAAVAEKALRKRSMYNFKHHTVNLLAEHNKLISTAVISGCLSTSGKDQKDEVDSAILSPATAVMARGSSAPDLKVFDTDESGNNEECLDSLPPLFSLETLHNQLSHRMIDEFLERITTLRTPLPSPPKTPHMSREDSSLSEAAHLTNITTTRSCSDRTLEVTVERLRSLSSAGLPEKPGC